MDFIFWIGIAIGLLGVLASEDGSNEKAKPNKTSWSHNPHSAAASAALREADWRCEHCHTIHSFGQSAPLHIEEFPFSRPVGWSKTGGTRFSKFQILCHACQKLKEKVGVLPATSATGQPTLSLGGTKRTRLSKLLRQQVLVRDNYTCRKCGARGGPHGAPGVQLHIDHIVPLAAGGTNDLNNLQVLCAPCNSKKGGRPWETFRRWVDAFRGEF